MESRRIGLLVLSALALILSACGGGGGSSSGNFNRPPTITGIADATISANQTAGAISFSVNDPQGVSTVTVSANSDNEALFPAPSISLAGSGESRTITLTPRSDRTGTANITVSVTDDLGLSASTSFAVTVTTQADVSYSAYFRAAFQDAATATPRDVNSRAFTNDADTTTFADLVQP